eukprot:SAG31_NODE_1193_length_9454_cov_38.779156_3_plen_60_part_00
MEVIDGRLSDHIGAAVRAYDMCENPVPEHDGASRTVDLDRLGLFDAVEDFVRITVFGLQ